MAEPRMAQAAIEPSFLARMRINVARSEEHIETQLSLVARLRSQGHQALAVTAEAVLLTMNGHLSTERDILARLEAEEAVSTRDRAGPSMEA